VNKSKKLVLLLFFAGLLVFFFQAMGDQAAAQSRDHKSRPTVAPVKGDQSNTEKVMGYVKSSPKPGPKQNNPLDTAGVRSVLRPSTTIGHNGDPRAGMATQAGVMPGLDIHVRTFDGAYLERNPAMASDSAGNLYVAFQNIAGYDYIQLYFSQDGGTNWAAWGYVDNASADLKNPSLAIGEGSINGNTLLLAYVVDDGVNIPYIEVATRPLDASTGFTVQSVPYFDGYEGYDKPVIWTDAASWDEWFAYLCSEWIIDSAADDVDVAFWKSEDGGSDWGTTFGAANVIRGDPDVYGWRDPDGAYGVYSDNIYVVCYQDDDQTLYLSRSDDYGDTFATDVAINTLTEFPASDSVDPEIEAAATDDNVMVVCTKGSTSDGENIGQCYSQDDGATWTTLWTLEGATTADEFAPALKANETGGDFHLVYTDSYYYIHYSRRPQDLSDYWQSTPTLINDTDKASWSYSKKGIASNWTWDFPFFCWSDYRDDAPNDYDIYFDRLYPDDLLGTWTGQGVYFRNEMGDWTKLATPANLIAAGDLDGDNTADPIGIWPSQGGVWVLPSISKSWAKLSSTATDIYAGDMDGDGTKELVGTWDGQGVYYLTQMSGGTWVKMATPATLLAAGDIDGDTIDDLIGVWPSQGGVWVKYSSSSLWEKLGTTPRHIAAGDMNGDGWDDLVGTWDSQGVYYKDSDTGSWVKMATPATLIAAGDIDGDGADDLVGIWPSQGGVWVKYSSTGLWAKLGSTPVDLAAGMMRGGVGTWGAQIVSWTNFQPVDGGNGPVFGPGSIDISATAPGAPGFIFQTQRNLEPLESLKAIRKPGPGEVGFGCAEQENLSPFEEAKEKVVPARATTEKKARRTEVRQARERSGAVKKEVER